MTSSGPDEAFALAGTTLAETWVVDAFVDQGGFGVVYRGHHARTLLPVAIKVLKFPPTVPVEERAHFVAGFEREAQVLARLGHPAIVKVLDLSKAPEAQGLMWMVLEWVDGERLDHILAARRARGDRWTPAACLAVLRPVFLALAEAHAHGIVHRDLKPSNIIVGPSGARLLDFGIAKLIDPGADTPPTGDTKTTGELLAYSLPYAAPEQVAHNRTTPRTDVHAMALILSEMLCARAPYGERGAEKGQMMFRALHEVRPTPAAAGLSVGAWEPVLARSMALAPAARFTTAGELLRALEEALSGATAADEVAPTQTMRAATPPPRVESAVRPTAHAARRTRALAGLGVAAFGVALLGLWGLRGGGGGVATSTHASTHVGPPTVRAAPTSTEPGVATGTPTTTSPVASQAVAQPQPTADAGASNARGVHARVARVRGAGGATAAVTAPAQVREAPAAAAGEHRGEAPPGGL